MDDNLLFDLAYGNDASRIRDAIAQGHDPNMVHPRAGHTPLQAACEADSLAAIDALLSVGADPNLIFTIKSRTGAPTFANRTAIMYASSAAAIAILADAGADIDYCDDLGWSALAISVDSASTGVFFALVDYGAIVELRDPLRRRFPTLLDLCDDNITFLSSINQKEPSSEGDSRLIALGAIREFLSESIRENGSE